MGFGGLASRRATKSSLRAPGDHGRLTTSSVGGVADNSFWIRGKTTVAPDIVGVAVVIDPIASIGYVVAPGLVQFTFSAFGGVIAGAISFTLTQLNPALTRVFLQARNKPSISFGSSELVGPSVPGIRATQTSGGVRATTAIGGIHGDL